MAAYNSFTAPLQLLEQQTYMLIAYQCTGAMQTMSIYQHQMQKHNFDVYVANEMSRVRNIFAEEESKYVQEKLSENPVDIEHHIRSSSSNGFEVTGPEDMKAKMISPERLALLKRAASCRKSRINNKLKKAILQYRSDFLEERALQSKKAIAEMRRKLKSVEQRLSAKGYSQAVLANLRAIYGVKTCIDDGDDKEVSGAWW